MVVIFLKSGYNKIYKTYNKKRGSVVADPRLTQFTARRAATI